MSFNFRQIFRTAAAILAIAAFLGLVCFFVLALAITHADAQSVTRICLENPSNPSQCWPVTPSYGFPTAVAGGTTTHVGSTIAATNTFQAALAASSTRKSCMLQNNGTNAMYVFFGTIGSATTSNAIKLAAGQTVSCNAPGVVITDAVAVTGTMGDAYVVTSQ
jgi:hypothetical protein